MNAPFLIVNFKAYPSAIGENAVVLAKIMDEVAQEFSASLIAATQPTDIYRVASEVNIPVFAQHVDTVKTGSQTGWVTISSIKEAGAKGSLLNHSEHPLLLKDIETFVNALKKEGLDQVVCAPSVHTSAAIAHFHPWAIAMEPPELIGGDISVTTKPEIIVETVKEIQKVASDSVILTGAGVKKGEHVAKALELGTKGVLLASGVTKAAEPKAVLIDLVKNMINY